ncbi:MAG: hypothetical protein JW910_22875 [Anaerolineae bacterium]|nr:hypothetical protein [Anaerolineae bacterium]
MRRSFWIMLLCGLCAAFFASVALAQGDGDAAYVGAQECRSCHQGLSRDHATSMHGLALIDTAANPEAVLADFAQGEGVRTVVLPGEATARPFMLADVAYTMGAGRYAQRFVAAADDGTYYVLPAQWNTQSNVWEPFTLAASWPDEAYAFGPNCARCHTVGLEVETFTWLDDGVQCEACHGPGSTHVDLAHASGIPPATADLAVIRDAIYISADPQVCGQCHSVGTDPHTGLPYPVGYAPGDDLLDPDVFVLAPPEDAAAWWPTGHARQVNMQFSEWLYSGHSVLPSYLAVEENASDACLRCHSADYRYVESILPLFEDGTLDGQPPDAVTVATAQFGVACTTCHSLHSDADFYVAVEDVNAELCVTCHSNPDTETIHHPAQEMLAGVTLIDDIEGVPSPHYTAEDGPDCQTCHMPEAATDEGLRTTHRLSPVLAASPSDDPTLSGVCVSCCTTCHTDVTADAMYEFVRDTRVQTQIRLDSINAELTDRPQSQTPDWVYDAVAFVEGDGSLGLHNHAYTEDLLDAVERALGLVSSGGEGADALAPVVVHDPATCEECHADIYRSWETSPHGHSSLNTNFLRTYAENGQPGYCMRCHASGYDINTDTYAYEGIVCDQCHIILSGAEHPPAPFEVLAEDSAICGRCHSGAHAPTYDEWLASSHSAIGIDCVDCHTPHENGLLLGDVNTTCGDCHQEALVDEVHMGDDMTCVDCHMARPEYTEGQPPPQTGHTMNIDPSVCADCHGNTHVLTAEGVSEDDLAHIEAMQAQIDQLEETASQNLNFGVIGGALGALLLGLIVVFVLRVGRSS